MTMDVHPKMSWIPAVLYCLGLVLAAEQFGLLAHPTYSLLAMICLSSGMGFRLVPGWKGRFGLFMTSIAAAGILLTTLPLPVRFFPLAISFSALARIRNRQGSEASAESLLAMTCALFGIYQFSISQSPLIWHLRENVATLISLKASIQHAFHVGPTYLSFDLLMLVLLAAGARFLRGGRARPSLITAAAGVGLLAMFTSLMASISLLADSDSAFASMARTSLGWLHPVSYGWLAALLLSFPVIWLIRNPYELRSDPRSPGWLFGTAVLFAALAPLFLYVAPPDLGTERTPRIALLEKGFLNWARPRPEIHGPGTVGMLGMLPHFLETKGFEAERIAEINPESLNDFDALVIINQTDPLPPESKAAIDTFVRSGGGLLVLGDHTTWRHEQVLINEPLHEHSIAFNFDNAEFFAGGWVHSNRFWSHSILKGIDDFENNAGIVVGASLAISYPAVPLVVGQYGFSDPGEVTAVDRGYMGNRKHDAGERLGDLVLAAIQDVDQGRLAVVGDTSSFANGILTSAWPFVSQLFDWLVSDARAAPHTTLEILALLGFLSLIVAWSRLSARSPVEVCFLALFFGAMISSGSFAGRNQAFQSKPLDPDTRSDAFPIAVIDHSHLTRGSREGVRDDGYSGLATNLMREDYLPLQVRNFDRELVSSAELVVICSPGRAYSFHEVELLDAFVQAGGELLLCLGRDDRPTAQSLLKFWNLNISDVPFGRDQAWSSISNHGLSTFEAWEVEGAPALIHHRHPENGTRALAVRKPVGKGHVTLIGDGHFFRDKNLETREGPAKANVKFLREYVALVRKGSRP